MLGPIAVAAFLVGAEEDVVGRVVHVFRQRTQFALWALHAEGRALETLRTLSTSQRGQNVTAGATHGLANSYENSRPPTSALKN